MIAALGAFDGLHRGHQALLRQAAQLAVPEERPWGVVTFSPHPQAVMAPGRFQGLFSEMERRLLAAHLSIPRWEVLPFSHGLADMLPERFLDLLDHHFSLQGVVVGENFRFGQGRRGDVALLRDECARRCWQCAVVSPVLHAGRPVSSTTIRHFLQEGNMKEVQDRLGYPFGVVATVVHGDHRGRGLGFPTANLAYPSGKLLPPGGVYGVAALAEGNWYAGAANVGHNPTFSGLRSLRCEVFLLDYSGDLYEKSIGVFFLERLREERRFPSVEELVGQMHQDKERARECFLREMACGERARFFRNIQKLLSTGSAQPSGPARGFMLG